MSEPLLEIGARVSVTIMSIFRDSTDYVDRYFTQVADLERFLQEPVRLVVAEGDSTDDTYDALAERLVDHAQDDVLLKVDHGGPKYGSVDVPERWAQVAQVCNAAMEQAANYPGPKIYVESDLIWGPPVMEQLLEDLAFKPAVAPMSMTEGRFYDLWGHRGLDGEKFTITPPYHPDLQTEAPLVEISSAGSCVVMREEVAQMARFGQNDCIVGLGREIRHRAGASLWLDKRVSVQHP